MKRRLPIRAVVKGLGVSVPERILENAELEGMVDTSDEWIVTRTGIRERRILSEDKATSDMAVEAAGRALEEAGVAPAEVDLVIVGTFTPDYPFPSTACITQRKLGLVNAGAFDVHAACSGFIYALATGAQFVAGGLHKNVLVIGADAASRQVDWRDRSTCVIFGDGAAAVLLQPSKSGNGVLSSYLRADGNGWRHLHQPAGGSAQPASVQTVQDRLHYIKMEGRETFKFAIRAMTDAASEAVARAGLRIEDIDLLVPHQANHRIVVASAERLGFSDRQVVQNIDRYGNTVAASIGLALNDARVDGRIRDGDHLLLIGFGAGLTWGGIVLRWGP